MGFTTVKHQHGSYQNFWPDDDENKLYIETKDTTIYLNNLIDQIKDHFGENSQLADFTIESQHIHTNCLGYDRYDSSDYTNFILVSKINKS